MTSEVPAVPRGRSRPGRPGRSSAPALEMRGITKRYPGVVANDHIDLDVRPGEIHALLGENGAGKTTLMNILYGLARPDEGEILLDGAAGPDRGPVRRDRPRHQHGPPALHARAGAHRRREHRPRRRDDGRPGLPRPQGGPQADRRARPSASASRSTRTPRSTRCRSASSSASRSSRRSTATRGSSSSTSRPRCSRRRRPRRSSRSCAASRPSGHSIIFISHKLYEVLEIADRITVIRRGQVVGAADPGGDQRGGPRRADGRPRGVADRRPRRVPPGRRRSCASTACASRTIAGSEVVHGVDLEVRGGEILGIAGVAGNGQDELVEAIIGLRRPAGGSVSLDGKDVTGRSPRSINELGVGYVPADRHRFGLVLSFPIADNLVLTSYYRAPYARGILRNDAAIARRRPRGGSASSTCARRPPMPARTLSGGNQQKVVVAREFDRDLRLLVLDQPTRGLDVGSIEFIHRQIDRQARRGHGRAAGLGRAGRGPRDVRPDRGDVPRQDRGRRRRPDGGQERGRPADGDRRRAEPARRRSRRVTEGGTRADEPLRRRRTAGDRWPCRSSRIVLAVARRPRGHHRRRSGSSPGHLRSRARRSRPTGRCSSGSVGSFNAIVNTLVVDDAAAPRRPVGRPRLQGRAVQHRRAGPVPDGRPRCGHRRRPAGRAARDHRRPAVALSAGCSSVPSGASSRAS